MTACVKIVSLFQVITFQLLITCYKNFIDASTFSSFDHLIFTKNNKSENVYNKLETPKRDNGSKSALIEVYVHIESIRDIASDAILDFYLVQKWNDSRLGQYDQEIKITGRILPNNVWYPDTYFMLVRSLIYSAEEQYFIIQRSGWIEYNRKVRLITPCSPNVLLFPFDVVRCSLVMSSFGYIDSEVQYQWDQINGGVFVDPVNNDVDHLGFYVLNTEYNDYTMTYGPSNYSALRALVYLERKYTAYLLQVYAPAALIVILSWSIFWVNINATPARASLGVTTVLTILTLATKSTSQNEKHVSGKLTALDIYIWACFVFVIFAMLEFALSDYTTYRRKEKELRHQERSKVVNALRPNYLFASNQPGSPSQGCDLHQNHLKSNSSGTSNNNNNNNNNPIDNNSPSSPTNNQISPQTTPHHHDFTVQSNSCVHTLITDCMTHSECSSPLLKSSEKNSFRVVGQSDPATPVFRESRHMTTKLSKTSQSLSCCSWIQDGRLLNNSARILFPVLFLFFNIVYWLTLYIMIKANKNHEMYDPVSQNY